MACHAQREAIYQRAREALAAGDYRSAHGLLRYLVRHDPEDAEARSMLARLQAQQAASSPVLPHRTNRYHRGPTASETRLGLRSMSLIGAVALLLLLVVALLLPSATALSAVGAPARQSEPPSQLRSANYALARLPIASSDDPTGETATAANGVPAEPPVPAQGGTCISGFSIDRYDQAAGAGWTVILTSEGGDPQPTVADAQGHFKFKDLASGTYSVTLEIAGGWRAFSDTSFAITLSGSGTECADVRFKVEALPCLLVNKVDAGSNGQVGIPGWQMTAIHGDISLKAVTDGTGKAHFYDLVPGTWTVTEESKIGWEPAAGHGYQKSLNLVSPRRPGACETLTFSNQQIHDSCIQVRNVDPVGVPVKGWKVTVHRDDGTQPSLSNYTDSSGYVIFKGLALGQWTVQEYVKAGWRPAGVTERAVELSVPGECEVVIFANEPLGCVDGYKINHLHQALGGSEITAQNEATGEAFATVTDETGYFQFQYLSLGTWSISEQKLEGWDPVTPSELTVKVEEPFACVSVRFKNEAKHACLDAVKRDAADGSGLAGWEMTLQPAYGGEAVTGVTDGTGSVRFSGLPPGTYIVSETGKLGWKAVTPSSKKVTLQATGTCQVVTFKNRQ
jgi:hypothetical protein